MSELGGANLHDENFGSTSAMGEADTKNIEHNISKYDMVSMLSRTRKILSFLVLRLVG